MYLSSNANAERKINDISDEVNVHNMIIKVNKVVIDQHVELMQGEGYKEVGLNCIGGDFFRSPQVGISGGRMKA
nr:hypothetical protein [Tanacetum cinerariifolium]